MQYNFDIPVDRSGNHAAKYDERLKRFGRADVLPLWVADMDFCTAQPIMDALEARAREGIWGYTSRPDSYFEAICGWQQRRHGWTIDKSLCSWSLGVVPAMCSMAKIFAKPGDKILIQTPVYSEFFDIVQNAGCVVAENKLLETDTGWEVDWDDFAAQLKDIKMFLLCSPHNPVGKVWPRADLERMLSLCAEQGVLVVSDEIHSDLVFHGKVHIPSATIDPNVISCISCTKTFNLAGLQAATIVFPDAEKKKAFDWFWASMDIHRNNAFSLTAMEVACNEGEEWLDQLLPYLAGNLAYVQDYCQKHIPAVRANLPDATYLQWLDCRALGLDDAALAAFMVEKAGLGLNEGISFGRSGFMRLNVAVPRKMLEQAMHQLQAAVEALGR